MDEKRVLKETKYKEILFLMCIQLDYSITKQNFICVYFDISEKVNMYCDKVKHICFAFCERSPELSKISLEVGSLFVMKCHFYVS